MFAYHLHLAWLSIKKSPAMSGLIMAAIGLGIGVCITVLTVYTMMLKNPAPDVADRLLTYKLNNQPVTNDGSQGRKPYPFASYRDALAIAESDFPAQHSIHYQTAEIYQPEDRNTRPFRSELRLVNYAFFNVHNTEFLYGAPWSASNEKSNPYQAILTKELNDKLYQGENSVGKRIQIGNNHFSIVGVIDDYTPLPKYLEVDSGPYNEISGAMVPFSLTPQLALKKKNGDFRCEDSFRGDGDWEGLLNSDCYWLHHWVMLSDGTTVEDFKIHLNNYAQSQQSFGRFKGPVNVETYNVMAWLEDREVVNKDYEFLLGVAFMFLIVCLLNCIGLLLTKFIGKASQISLRRAVGATRKEIFFQHLVEVGLLGFIGGVFGIFVSLLGLSSLRVLYENYDLLTHLNVEMIITTIVLSIVTTILSGLLPSWRVCRLPAAQYLKS